MNIHDWRVRKAFGIAAFVVLAAGLLGGLVTLLWNWLMPSLFGLSTIVFWQGLGLFVLCRLLFGGFRGFGRHRRHRMHERWRHMTPQQRESFSRGLHRCRWGSRSNDSDSQAAG